MHMATSIRSLYYVYERSGSRVKHTLHKHATQTRYTNTLHKHATQTHATQTHATQTRYTNTLHKHATQTHATQTRYTNTRYTNTLHKHTLHKHTLHKGCQLQIRYLLFMSKEGSIYGLYTHVCIIVGILGMIEHTNNIHDGESVQLRVQIPYIQLTLSY